MVSEISLRRALLASSAEVPLGGSEGSGEVGQESGEEGREYRGVVGVAAREIGVCLEEQGAGDGGGESVDVEAGDPLALVELLRVWFGETRLCGHCLERSSLPFFGLAPCQYCRGCLRLWEPASMLFMHLAIRIEIDKK